MGRGGAASPELATKDYTATEEDRMEKRSIGSLEVTVVGLGCNNFGRRLDSAATAEVVEAALDAGINFFDTADIYGYGQSEEYLGRALAGRREEVIIATKFGMPMDDGSRGAHPDYIARAVEDSLRRLQTDYIDLYQVHEPDPEVPIEETLGALDRLVEEGKVREIGSSNFSAAQLREAAAVSQRTGWSRFVSVQNEYSLLHRAPEAPEGADPESGVLETCEELGIAFIPFFPLASGLLTGKYRKGQPIPPGTRVAESEYYQQLLTDENLDRIEALISFAESGGHRLLDLAFSWLLSRPTVASVIAGATSPEQVRNNASAASWRLTGTELQEIDEMIPAPL